MNNFEKLNGSNESSKEQKIEKQKDLSEMDKTDKGEENKLEEENKLREQSKSEKEEILQQLRGKIANISAAAIIGFSSLTGCSFYNTPQKDIGELLQKDGYEETLNIQKEFKNTKITETEKSIRDQFGYEANLLSESSPEEKLEWFNWAKEVLLKYKNDKEKMACPFFIEEINKFLLDENNSEQKKMEQVFEYCKNLNDKIQQRWENREREQEINISGFDEVQIFLEKSIQQHKNNIKALEEIKFKKNFQVDSFETDKKVFSNEKVREILQTYPESWIDTRDLKFIECIYYTDEDFGGKTFSKGYGNPTGLQVTKDVVCSNFKEILSHELAHVNDWKDDGSLCVEDRIWLFDQVSKRVNSESRYSSFYVEENFQDSAAKKTSEYWAEICREYFVNPNSENLPDTDRMLIKSYLEKIDPDFNAEESAKLRNELLQLLDEMILEEYKLDMEEFQLINEIEKKNE